MSMGERMTWENILCSRMGEKWEHDVFAKENEVRFDWWRRFKKIVYLVFLELRCFSCMLPSMPKGEIVSMNDDDITIGEYWYVVFMTVFVIDVNIAVSLWRQIE